MPDTPFKAMGREPSGLPKSLRHLRWLDAPTPSVSRCERCGGHVATGDWPFCRPGHPEDHER